MNDDTPVYSTDEAAALLGWNGPSLTSAALRCGLRPAHAEATRYRWSRRDVVALRALLEVGLIGADAKARSGGASRTCAVALRDRVWRHVHHASFTPGSVLVVPWYTSGATVVDTADVPDTIREVGPAVAIPFDAVAATAA